MRIELVQLVPGSCWNVNAGTGVHHTGCWSEDLESDAAGLEAQGWPIVAHGVDDGSTMATFSYHQVPGIGLFGAGEHRESGDARDDGARTSLAPAAASRYGLSSRRDTVTMWVSSGPSQMRPRHASL